MDTAVRQIWTRDDFLTWAETQEGRYEFDGTGPIPMTGGTLLHNLIAFNIHRALSAALAGGPCTSFGLDAGITTTGGAVRYPDALVTCSPIEGEARLVPNPVVVFEVVSPSSVKVDTIEKVTEYATVPSIRRYVIVEPKSIGLRLLSRVESNQPWTTTTLTIGAVLAMPEIGIEISVDDIYDRRAVT